MAVILKPLEYKGTEPKYNFEIIILYSHAMLHFIGLMELTLLAKTTLTSTMEENKIQIVDKKYNYPRTLCKMKIKTIIIERICT